jgi:putative MATE family efflux protein
VPDPESSLTDGDLVRPLFRLAWPIVVTELLQVTYNLADTFWLGRLSTDAVAAVSLAFPIILLFIALGGGLTVAGSTLVAQYVGAGSDRSAGAVAGGTLTVVGGFATVIGVVGALIAGPALSLLPASGATGQQVLPLAVRYMRVFFLGLPFLFGFFVFAALMRGYGNTRTPMVVTAVSVVFNVILDPVLIFGWGPVPALGIEGAAVATILARGSGSLLGLYVLFATDLGPAVTLSDFVPDLAVVRRILTVGVPAALEQSANSLGLITLTAMVVTFRPEVVAAYGLGNRLTSLVFLPALGLGRATNTMVGQNLGAGKPDRAERAVWLAAGVGSALMLGVGVLAYLFPEPAVAVFIGTEGASARETIRLGAQYIRVRAFEFGFIGLFQTMLGAYRGAGNTRTALGFSLVALWVGRVPIVYGLALVERVGGDGVLGIWIGMAAGPIIGAVAAAVWFTRGTWKAAVVGDADSGDDATE